MYFKCPRCNRLQLQIKAKENYCVYCFPVNGISPTLIEVVVLKKEELKLLLSLVPDWAKIVPEGLAPMFYGTGTYENDLEIMQQVDIIRKKNQ